MRIKLDAVEYSMKDTKRLHPITGSFTKGMTYVVGKNGAGKSTLLKLLATAIQPQQGEITFTTLVRDDNMGTYRKWLTGEEIRKIIGFLPQHFTGYSAMTVEKYIMHLAFHKGIPAKRVKKTVAQWLQKSCLSQVKRKELRHLSGGQRKKVGLIQALINHPRICILDEPFAGLDIEERLYFQRILQRLSYHSIVILSTHLLDEIQPSSEDQLLYLNEGKMAYFGGVEALDSVTQRLQKTPTRT